MTKEKEVFYNEKNLILAKEIKEVLESLDFPNCERVENYKLYKITDFSFDEETEEEKNEFIENVDLCVHNYLVAKYIEEIALEEEKELEKLNGYSSYYFDDYFKSNRALKEANKYVEYKLREKTTTEILEMLKKEVK